MVTQSCAGDIFKQFESNLNYILTKMLSWAKSTEGYLKRGVLEQHQSDQKYKEIKVYLCASVYYCDLAASISYCSYFQVIWQYTET